MEAAGEQPRTVERPEVGDFLDHAQRPLVAARIGTDAARVDGVDIAAGRTGGEVARHPVERDEQRVERGLALLDQMQHRTARGTGAETGKAGKRLGQRVDFGRGHRNPR